MPKRLKYAPDGLTAIVYELVEDNYIMIDRLRKAHRGNRQQLFSAAIIIGMKLNPDGWTDIFEPAKVKIQNISVSDARHINKGLELAPKRLPTYDNGFQIREMNISFDDCAKWLKEHPPLNTKDVSAIREATTQAGNYNNIPSVPLGSKVNDQYNKKPMFSASLYSRRPEPVSVIKFSIPKYNPKPKAVQAENK